MKKPNTRNRHAKIHHNLSKWSGDAIKANLDKSNFVTAGQFFVKLQALLCSNSKFFFFKSLA